MNDKVPISEKQAKDMLDVLCRFDRVVSIQGTIQNWKQFGYIKQSKLDEAREWIKKWGRSCSPLTECYQDDCAYMIRLHEAAIAEILEEKQS